MKNFEFGEENSKSLMIHYGLLIRLIRMSRCFWDVSAER